MQGAVERIKGRKRRPKAEERTNMERRGGGGGAFSRNGLALISLSRSAARYGMEGERGERNRPKTLSSFAVLGYID